MCLLRRPIAFLAPLAALLFALPAAAALEPVRRPISESGPAPVVRAGSLYVPPGHNKGRVSVVVRLHGAPLAATGGRSLQSRTRTKLNMRSTASVAYLTQLAAQQRTAAARLTKAIPEARVLERYRVVLNGFTVNLPARKLPKLMRLALAAQVYPNVRYSMLTNRSPEVIRAATFSSLKGFKGDGIKIGIVDDGIDPRSPFLQGDGYAYPAGFPRGGSTWVNRKIIVARAFPGPNSGRQGREAFVPQISFHGTHVAGIAAATRNNNIGIAGVARLGIMAMGCAVWTITNAATGQGEYRIGSADDAINDAVVNNATVINCSFGQTAPLRESVSNALNSAQNAGVLVVCAAGNDGVNILNSPSAGWAAHAWPIIVSNMQQDDHLNAGSNFGNRIDLAAPGTGIASTCTTNYQAPQAGGTYTNMTGTSQASPHVAGAAGLVRSMNPNRIASIGTKSLLFRMAQDLGTTGRDTLYGFGVLQVPASFLSPLRNANTFVGPNPFPVQDGSYEFPYPSFSDALSATVTGGTIVLNGGVTGTTLSFPAQTFNTPLTLMAFPDRPVTFGN